MSIFIHHGQSSLEIRENPRTDIRIDELSELLEKLKSSDSGLRLQVDSANPDELLKACSHRFTWLEAAGGLIENESDEVLLIYRRGYWDLPKGKIDAGETPRVAAEREIEEETGITRLRFVNDLPSTYHIYFFRTEWVLKKTHWFRYQLTEPQTLTLQKEEDIEDAKWIRTDELENYLDKIYPSLHTLIRSVMG